MPTYSFESTPPERRALMRQIRSKGTKPELLVRSLTHRLGYRFRLHYRGLPGTPDLAFPGRRKVVFVNGCFWHRHTCTVGQKVPNSNRDYWLQKFQRNVERDRLDRVELVQLGWQVLVIWECETKDLEQLKHRLAVFLDSDRSGQK